jgi:hypothetical protein
VTPAGILLAVLGIAAFIGAYLVFWKWAAPAIGDEVGKSPYLAVVVGWAPGGVAMLYTGELLIRWDRTEDKKRRRHAMAAVFLVVVGLLTVPGVVDGPAINSDYYAGLYASVASVMGAPILISILGPLVYWLFTRTFELFENKKVFGYALVAGTLAMLALGCTYYRTF